MPDFLRSLREWQQRQAAATVKKYPDLAAGVLEGLGYGVVHPPGQPRDTQRVDRLLGKEASSS